MGSVKTPKGVGTVASRIRTIRRALNPHGDKEMPWPAFAAFAGAPLGTAKKWEQRSQISPDSAEQLAEKLAAAGLSCTARWIRKGTPPAPEWAGTRPGGAPGLVTARQPTPTGRPGLAGAADDPSFAGSGADLFDDLVRRPDEFTRRLNGMLDQVGTEAVLAFLEDAEKIVKEHHGPRFTAFFKALRDRIRAGERGGRHSA